MSGIFDRYYKRYDAWYGRNRYTYLSELRAIRKFLPRKGKGLEIGVGTGRFAGPLKTQGFSSFSYCQTLFDYPHKINSIERAQRGFGKGGFVVISAQK